MKSPNLVGDARRDLPYESLSMAPVTNEVSNSDHLEIVPGAVLHQIGTRAIVPSSFMISQMTPAGISPAKRARSTAASV
jgi:hypothetical protein